MRELTEVYGPWAVARKDRGRWVKIEGNRVAEEREVGMLIGRGGLVAEPCLNVL